MKDIYEYIISKADKYLKNPQQLEDLKQILKNKNVGLLVNERLVNMPPEVVPQLHN